VAAITTDGPPGSDDLPRAIPKALSKGDRVFRALSGGAAALCLVIMAATAVFLTVKAIPALTAAGPLKFLTDTTWEPDRKQFGVGGLLINTILIAGVALLVAVPLSLGLALFINEYAPGRIRRVLTSAVDLLAAIPSLIFGMWGFFALQEPLIGVATWIADHLNAIPLFRLTAPDAALSQSTFVAGIVVAFMVTPVITSVSRDVMAQCPRVQCEGALALGGSRWGMIRDVVLPFGRSGIVGSVLLGFGRALGETIAVVLVIALVYTPNLHILEKGSGSISALIATKFGEAQGLEISGLIAAGLALFIMTLIVNLFARSIVRRSQVA
jgi:phosphate transport system permease protein